MDYLRMKVSDAEIALHANHNTGRRNYCRRSAKLHIFHAYTPRIFLNIIRKTGRLGGQDTDISCCRRFPLFVALYAITSTTITDRQTDGRTSHHARSIRARHAMACRTKNGRRSLSY